MARPSAIRLGDRAVRIDGLRVERALFSWEESRVPGMGEANPIVLVIDDDPEFRDSIVRLLRTVGLEPGNFRLFSIFSRLIRQSAPPAWCST